MNKIKNNLPIILVTLSSILFVVAILLLVNANIFKSNNNVNSNGTNSKEIKNINNDNKETNPVVDNKDTTKDEQESNKIEPTSVPQPSNIPVPTIEPTSTPTPIVPTPTATPIENVITKSEESIINYFQTKESEVKAGDEKTFGEKAKDGFVSIVDFIFYDKEINGYKFKELTNTAKLKIIAIALKIDSKIDSYFPNYKDKIKGTYTNIKEKLVEKYLEYSQKICESSDTINCDAIKADWEVLKKNFSITGEYLKNLGITGADKLKSWYENWRDK